MHFVIAGRINCPKFSYALMVAQRLKENLPDFTYLKICKNGKEWDKYLLCMRKEYNWCHMDSPLIWREIGLKKGKREYIGNINRFLDICYDYYGIPKEIIGAQGFKESEMKWFRNRTEEEYFKDIKLEAKKKREYKSRQICITGASSFVAEVLIMEILQIRLQSRKDGLEIRLFDDPKKTEKLTLSASDANYCPGLSGFGNCRIANSLKEALTNIDLVIVLDAFYRKPEESLVKWLKRNRNAMCSLGKALNKYAPTHCRVIIGSPSNQPICYNATVLACFATKLHVRNIVVVTQDLGREALRLVSSKIKVPVHEMYCPPVWGFIGLNKFVDLRKTLQNNVYKVPGMRKNSTLPQGSEEFELRTIDCLLTDGDTTDILVKVSEHKSESYPQLGRWPCMAKATAIIDLLKLWGIEQKDGNGEVICLGVYSDGTFSIPQGLYWSQPVILKDGFWTPFPHYPVPREYDFNGYYLFLVSLAALYRTKIKPRRYNFPEKINKRRMKKFNFDKIIKDIGMPVIRTDAECVEYLKNLAKNELGIDFSGCDEDFEEEPEEIKLPEPVKREELYCECWRNELKELQKVIFYRPSSTEIEVDLSENISGSEWSVINPNSSYHSETHEKTNDVQEKPDVQEKVSDLLQKKSSIQTVSTVCSCGELSTGFICDCLGSKKSVEGENISTEHFYKEQNATIYEDDLKDVIYADTYTEERKVTFHPDDMVEDKVSQLPRKFYGKKDAIRDPKADLKMKKRILNYEGESEESVVEKEIGETSEGSERNAELKNFEDPKFHIKIDGASYDIIGDKTGLEGLEMHRGDKDKTSTKSFRDMYTDEISPSLHVIPPDFNKSDSLVDSYSIFPEESATALESKDLKTVPGSEEEEWHGEVSLASLEEDVNAVFKKDLTLESEEDQFEYRGEFDFMNEREGEKGDEEKEGEEDEEEEKFLTKTPKVPKWKREGIPLCCLCRCVLPEGLPCCPCGGTTVVEVFKKESIAVYVHSEDDMDYRIEYLEKYIPPESTVSSDIIPEIIEEPKIVKALPPESFFPFSPKIPNVFKEKKRPQELSKNYLKSIRKDPEPEMPKKCSELLKEAKRQMEQGLYKVKNNFKELDEDLKKIFMETCTTEESPCKSDYSKVDLFLPDGIEDWRLTVQTKYREWFYKGPNLRDESYYDIAVEEISEDEFEIDKELEIYFET